MKASSELGIVIVAFGHGKALKPCLDELKKQKRPGDNIVLIDNHPDHESANYARKHDAVDTVVAAENDGFSGGCRNGVNHLPSNIDLILFLNPDVTPLKDSLDQIRKGDESWAAWMGLLVLPNGMVNSSGNLVHLSGLSWCDGYLEPTSKHLKIKEVDCLSGACLAIRRNEWELLDGLDETYFMYYEDTDLSYRLHLMNKKLGILPQAMFAHDYEFIKGDYKWYYIERNRLIFIIRTWPTKVLVSLLPILVLSELGLWGISLLQSRFRLRLKAIWFVFKNIFKLLSQRRKIQANRLISNRQFLEKLSVEVNTPLLGKPIQFINPVFRIYSNLVRAIIK